MSARTITRAEYDTKRHHGYAGPKSELLPETQEHWNATHWMLENCGAEGTCLVGVDVERMVPCEGSHHPTHYLPGEDDEMGRLMCKVCGQTFPIPNGDLVAPEHMRESV